MEKVLESYKWLNELPENILKKLNFEEFCLEHSKVNFNISQLEEKFDANIMIYKADDFVNHDSKKFQLCKTLQMKVATDSTIAQLKKLEMSSDVLISIVLYKRPVQFKI
jgi:hypothetical protein